MDGELVKMETNDCMNNGELINRDGNQQRMDEKNENQQSMDDDLMNKDGNQKEKE